MANVITIGWYWDCMTVDSRDLLMNNRKKGNYTFSMFGSVGT